MGRAAERADPMRAKPRASSSGSATRQASEIHLEPESVISADTGRLRQGPRRYMAIDRRSATS